MNWLDDRERVIQEEADRAEEARVRKQASRGKAHMAREALDGFEIAVPGAFPYLFADERSECRTQLEERLENPPYGFLGPEEPSYR